LFRGLLRPRYRALRDRMALGLTGQWNEGEWKRNDRCRRRRRAGLCDGGTGGTARLACTGTPLSVPRPRNSVVLVHSRLPVPSVPRGGPGAGRAMAADVREAAHL